MNFRILIYLLGLSLILSPLCLSQETTESAVVQEGEEIVSSEPSDFASDDIDAVYSAQNTATTTSQTSKNDNYNIKEISKGKAGCEVMKECQDVVMPRLGTRNICKTYLKCHQKN